jgi:hypothetical protein
MEDKPKRARRREPGKFLLIVAVGVVLWTCVQIPSGSPFPIHEPTISVRLLICVTCVCGYLLGEILKETRGE